MVTLPTRYCVNCLSSCWRRLRLLWTVGIAALLLASSARAAVYKWEWVDPNDHSKGKRQSSALLSTEYAGPGAQFDFNNFTMAYLAGFNLTNAKFDQVNLTDATLASANISGADFTFANITNADLTNARIDFARFSYLSGLTQAQLYSTASYQNRDLEGVFLLVRSVAGWDFSRQNISGARLCGDVDLDASGTNFAGANLSGAFFFSPSNDGHSNLTNANFTGANLTNVDMFLGKADGASFARANLSGANMRGVSLVNADFTNAIVVGTNFTLGRERGFTLSQLYSTASYKAHDLHGTNLSENDLTGAKFAGLNLRNANLRLANLANADFTNAWIDGANLSDASYWGFTPAMLYSTASYKAHDLHGVNF